MPVHFLHIGKTGGSAIRIALRRAGPDTPFGAVKLHPHQESRLRLVPPEDFVFFCVRDPISRFISGFNSRLRKGAPAYVSEWTPGERISFAHFQTPQHLAEALASRNQRERWQATYAMLHIRHLRPQGRFLESAEFVREQLERIVYVGRQETLDDDWDQIRNLLELPDDICLPRDERAHRSPAPPGPELDDRAVAVLRQWYAADFQIVRFCEELRRDRGWGARRGPAPDHVTVHHVLSRREGPNGSPTRAVEPSGGAPSMDTSALASIADRAADRSALWADLLVDAGARHVAEIGVYRGVFAEKLLDSCPDIETYYLVDPWRHLDEWNKPANRSDADFEVIYAEALRRTEKHSTKRVVLRGRTTDVIDEIPDGSLDFAYVDGDHTLRGITLDLHRVYGKVRDGGWIGGDDFCRSIWQHSEAFEPTMVFPYAVYFAEAVGVPVFGLPFRQFLIVKQPGQGFSFVDLTASYGSTELLRQVRPPISASKGEPAGRRHATRIAVRAISRSSRAARRLKRRVAQRTSR